MLSSYVCGRSHLWTYIRNITQIHVVEAKDAAEAENALRWRRLQAGTPSWQTPSLAHLANRQMISFISFILHDFVIWTLE
jgi:hypothetical protein